MVDEIRQIHILLGPVVHHHKVRPANPPVIQHGRSIRIVLTHAIVKLCHSSLEFPAHLHKRRRLLHPHIILDNLIPFPPEVAHRLRQLRPKLRIQLLHRIHLKLATQFIPLSARGR